MPNLETVVDCVGSDTDRCVIAEIVPIVTGLAMPAVTAFPMPVSEYLIGSDIETALIHGPIDCLSAYPTMDPSYRSRSVSLLKRLLDLGCQFRVAVKLESAATRQSGSSLMASKSPISAATPIADYLTLDRRTMKTDPTSNLRPRQFLTVSQ
jgi:hypothetical protein